jgi:hypothetical protein
MLKSMKIIEAKALPAFRLAMQFDNGEGGIVDLSEFAGVGVFAAWRQPGVFERVSVTADGAVEWPGQLDMCPDALYLLPAYDREEAGGYFPNSAQSFDACLRSHDSTA